MSDTLFDRQRAALARLTEAAAARVAADTDLSAAFQTARYKADHDIARARKAHTAALERDVGALDAQHAAAEERLARDFTTEQLNLERTRNERRKQTAERFNVKNAFDPKQNIRGGLAYLRWLLAYFEGDLSLVAAAYNSGEGTVDKYLGVPPYRETRTYVQRVLEAVGIAAHPFDAKVTQPSAKLRQIREPKLATNKVAAAR